MALFWMKYAEAARLVPRRLARRHLQALVGLVIVSIFLAAGGKQNARGKDGNYEGDNDIRGSNVH